MRLRPGHTYRIYDAGPVTVALDPEARGGAYSPAVSITLRVRRPRRDMTGWSPACTHVVRYHRLTLRLPVLGFARAWRLRRIGALRLWAAESRVIYRLFALRGG